MQKYLTHKKKEKIMLRARNLIFLLLVVMTACSNLISAAKQGSIVEVQTILDKDANIDETDSSGFTALMYAANNGHIEIVKLLLNKGADVSIVDNWGNTALILAASQDHYEIAKLLNKYTAKE
jgi:ankyrin repeat protein